MKVRERLFTLSFALQRIFTPGLRYSQTDYEEALRSKAANASRWLDLGCGHQLLPTWRKQSEHDFRPNART